MKRKLKSKMREKLPEIFLILAIVVDFICAQGKLYIKYFDTMGYFFVINIISQWSVWPVLMWKLNLFPRIPHGILIPALSHRVRAVVGETIGVNYKFKFPSGSTNTKFLIIPYSCFVGFLIILGSFQPRGCRSAVGGVDVVLYIFRKSNGLYFNEDERNQTISFSCAGASWKARGKSVWKVFQWFLPESV